MSYPPHIQKLVDNLWRDKEDKKVSDIYTILDLAQDEAIYAKMVASDIESLCLYEGEQAIEFEDVAPYLIRLYKGKPFTEWLLDKGWGKNWGIFIQSPAGLEELACHFRCFLKVRDEEGNPLMFRYYDPRVLRAYLPTCTEAELDYVFGPVERYYVEGEKENKIFVFSFENRLFRNVIYSKTTHCIKKNILIN